MTKASHHVHAIKLKTDEILNQLDKNTKHVKDLFYSTDKEYKNTFIPL